jgi:transposase
MSNDRFVAEIPIRWSATHERVALARLRTAQGLQNEALATFMRRANAYHRDPELKQLRAELAAARLEGRAPASGAAKKKRVVPASVTPRVFEFTTATDRSAAWTALRERHGLFGETQVARLTALGAHHYESRKAFAKAMTARQASRGAGGLDAATIHHEIIAPQLDRVLTYVGVKKIIRANGDRRATGAPRFASRRHPVTSVTGSSSAKNGGGLAVDVAGGTFTWKAAHGQSPIVARLRFPKNDPWLAKAVCLPIAQVRVLYRMLRGRRRWYVQLVLVGEPPLAPAHRRAIARRAQGVVGVDVGVRHIAAVGPDSALLADLAPTMIAREVARDRGVVDDRDGDRRKRDRWYRRLQRAISRKQLANPQNADVVRYRGKVLRKTRDGRAVGTTVEVPAGFKKRSRIIVSRRARAAIAQLAEVARADAAARDNDHGRLANVVLGMGDSVALERLSYVAWQRAFGRQVRRFAPGGFEARVRRRAPLFGADVVGISTSTRLSQVCHACGAFEATPIVGAIVDRMKPACSCGRAAVHRDLYSAFLARFVAQGTSIDLGAAKAAASGAFGLMGGARLTYDTAENGRLRPFRSIDVTTSANRAVVPQAQVVDVQASTTIADPTMLAPASVRDGAWRRSESRVERVGGDNAMQSRSNQAWRAPLPSDVAGDGAIGVRARPPLEKRSAKRRRYEDS